MDHSLLVTLAGEVPTSEAAVDIVGAIVYHDLADDWDGPALTAKTAVQLLLTAASESERAVLCAGGRRSSLLDELEKACIEHQVAFSVHCDADGGEDATIRTWQPGWAAPRGVPSDSGYRAFVDAEAIVKLAAAGATAAAIALAADAVEAGGGTLPPALVIPEAVAAFMLKMEDD